VKVPAGFLFSGIQAGIKPNRKDLALVYSQAPCSAAGCFTRNLARAAPVLDAEKRLPADGMHAVVINSGNANALTGPEGLQDVLQVCEAVARELGIAAAGVLSASTGVIGHRLPAHKILAATPALVQSLRPDALLAAEAIMTTDTRIKTVTRLVQIDGKEVTLTCICKGSGMIAPALATMIAVVATDCAISPAMLQSALRRAMGKSFNALTVGGDMSTNDCVFALANGAAGNAPIVDQGPPLEAFSDVLDQICRQMAKEIAADGEGATKLLEITVKGAPSEEIALDLAKAVAGSSLVKAAIFGADPNWGRVLSSIGARAGTAGYAIEPADAQVSVQDVFVYDRAPLPYDASVLKARMREPEVRVLVDLRRGAGNALAWGCDLSYDYVKINADYTSLIVPRPDGGVGKDDRLSNYSPTFKVQLLVEALGYIRKFSGTRCVVKYGGAAMVKESLKKSFCDDIGLLRSVGLRPIVVHGGGPEITRTLEKLGGKAEFVDGMRVTNASDLKVVEMVLTGAINTDLVTLLNQEFGHAVGVSGKDGALLRARKLVQEGRDLGQVGEVTRVNKDFLEMLLQQGYVPVISPVGLGEDGQSYNINADAVAAEIAIAVGAQKLIYLSDVPGVMKAGELIADLTAGDLEAQMADGTITGGMKAKARSILKALSSGVKSVHLIDGRVPHSIIGELFTDHGVGSLITSAAGAPAPVNFSARPAPGVPQ
jgi:acetylglutamate kinase